MSEPLRRIRLPPSALSWEKRLQIRRWMNEPAWDPELKYFAIDQVRAIWLSQDQQDLADDPDVIATLIFPFLAKDAEFHRFVVYDCDQDLSDDEWESATRAYAWMVLQRYNRELGGQDE